MEECIVVEWRGRGVRGDAHFFSKLSYGEEQIVCVKGEGLIQRNSRIRGFCIQKMKQKKNLVMVR